VAAVAPWVDSPPADLESSPIPVAPPPATISRAQWPRVRRLGLVLLTALTVALACAYFISRPPRKVMLVVLPFANLTGDSRTRQNVKTGLSRNCAIARVARYVASIELLPTLIATGISSLLRTKYLSSVIAQRALVSLQLLDF
jgi:hypothetical protein